MTYVPNMIHICPNIYIYIYISQKQDCNFNNDVITLYSKYAQINMYLSHNLIN